MFIPAIASMRRPGRRLPPPSPPPGGSTALAIAAAGMSSGSWLNFGASSGTTGLGNFTGGTGASGVRTPYMSEFCYDAANKRCLAHTGDHNEDAYLFAYDEATNAWSIDHAPAWADIGGAATARHGYDHNVFVPSLGRFYSRSIQNLNLRKWNGGTSWTDIPIPLFYNTSAAGQCYHAALDKILVFQLESGINGALVGMDPDTETWTTYASAGSGTLANTGDPHNFAVYNPTSGIAWFGGGNSVTTNWTINSSGTIAAASAIPGPLGMIGPGSGPSLALANPANGNFIVWFDATTWYDFDATARTYSARGGTATAFSSNMLAISDPGSADGMAGVMGCTIHEYGVIAFVKSWARGSAGEMWLFKP